MNNQKCARTVCGALNPKWWNKSTRDYYCIACAKKINSYAPGLCVQLKVYIQAGNLARLYIPYQCAFPGVVSHLEVKTRYMGSEGDTGKCYGWEVPQDVPGHKPLQELIAYLEGYGYVVEKVGAGNNTDVWK